MCDYDEYSNDYSDLEEDYEDLDVQISEPTRESTLHFLEEDRLLQQQNEIIDGVSQLLNVTPSAAASILRHFSWNYDELSQKYFEDEEKLRSSLGLNIGTSKPYYRGKSDRTVECKICYDAVPGNEALALKCRHFFCKECWSNFLIGKVGEGSSCLQAHCPAPKCSQAVDEVVFEKLLPKEHRGKYQKFLLRSFVEYNPTIRWCPAPGCNKAVQCQDTQRLFVPCLCGHRFCFRCGEAAHAPVQCENLRDWLTKEKDEGESSKWIYVNTKPCTKCSSPIEKNDGCNHMTCSRCKWEFCWLCLGDWSKHDGYNCNQFQKGSEVSKAKAREELARYIFYHDRYVEHQKSKEFNQSDLKKAEDKAELLKETTGGVSANYIVNAAEQLVENRSMLQYTYVYAYYLAPEDPAKALFEYLQHKLEAITEDFNSLLNKILNEEDADVIATQPEFSRERVVDMTSFAREQLHKLFKGVYDESEALATVDPTCIRNAKLEGAKSKARLPKNSPASIIPQFDDKLRNLQDMGFDHSDCAQALLASEGNVANALQILLASRD